MYFTEQCTIFMQEWIYYVLEKQKYICPGIPTNKNILSKKKRAPVESH